MLSSLTCMPDLKNNNNRKRDVTPEETKSEPTPESQRPIFKPAELPTQRARNPRGEKKAKDRRRQTTDKERSQSETERPSDRQRTMFVPLPVPFVFQRSASDFSAWRLKSSLAPRSSPGKMIPTSMCQQQNQKTLHPLQSTGFSYKYALSL